MSKKISPKDKSFLKPYQIDFGERGVYDTRNPLNDLTGKEWLFATKSVIPKSYPPDFSHELRRKHGGMKPPLLCKELIETFTKKGELVFDPLAGVGGTLIGATLAGRRAIGIEINKEWIQIYQQVCKENNLPQMPCYHGDCLQIMDNYVRDESVDFILTDVPFWTMDKLEQTRGVIRYAGTTVKKPNPSSLKKFNALPPQSKDDWLHFIESLFKQLWNKLKYKRYMAVFIGNMYRTVTIKKNGKKVKISKYHLLSADIARIGEQQGFILKAERIWYDPSKALGCYGYPFSYVPSIVDQRILIFRKEQI